MQHLPAFREIGRVDPEVSFRLIVFMKILPVRALEHTLMRKEVNRSGPQDSESALCYISRD